MWVDFRSTIFHNFFNETINDSDAVKMNPTTAIYLYNKVGMDPNVFENYVADANEILDEFGNADGKGLFNRLLTLGGT